MKSCKVIKHEITIIYTCPNNNQEYTLLINNPNINEGHYYEDWSYTYISFHCPHCNKEHNFEI